MSRKAVERDLVERQAARCAAAGANVDVYAIAAEVDDTARHGTVRNPNGLLIHRVTERLHEEADRRRAGEEQTHNQRQHYARAWVQVLRLVSERQMCPLELAGLLRALRGHGYPQINPAIAEELELLGRHWERQPRPPG